MHTHTHTHAQAHAHAYAYTHTQTHAHAHTHTTKFIYHLFVYKFQVSTDVLFYIKMVNKEITSSKLFHGDKNKSRKRRKQR